MKPMIYICVPTTKERRPKLEKLIESVRQSDYPNLTLVIHEGIHPGCNESLHSFMWGIKGLMFLLSDDNEVYPDTISILYDAYLKNFPQDDGCVSPYNEFQGGDLITAAFCRAETWCKYTFKGYIHNYSDNEFTEVLKSMDKHVYVPEARLIHNHWTNGKAEFDETYKSNNTTSERDRQLFIQRKANKYEPKNN
jgi:cellulose synthase/poly-beta-1,6-N-acetylglucosamine synthase-like glycosyltransferase